MKRLFCLAALVLAIGFASCKSQEESTGPEDASSQHDSGDVLNKANEEFHHPLDDSIKAQPADTMKGDTTTPR